MDESSMSFHGSGERAVPMAAPPMNLSMSLLVIAFQSSFTVIFLF